MIQSAPQGAKKDAADSHGSVSALESESADSLTGFPVFEVGQIPFRSTTLEEATDWLLSSAENRTSGLNVRLANAYNIALASRDSDYQTLLRTEGVNFPDGTPVVWFMNLQRGTRRSSRVRGPSLFPLALSKSTGRGTRHFFLGGSPETLKRLERRVHERFPDVDVAGTYSPPFAPIDENYVTDCAARVRTSGANIVWIGLGTPKQDLLGTALARETSTLSINVGAAFDFLAGTAREAPRWVQSSGFEWLFRMLSEPRRLWRRYLIGNLCFLAAAIRHFRRSTDSQT